MAKTKFYAVARGHQPGIYQTWPEAEAQVSGFHGARHKSFHSHDEAQEWLDIELGRAPATTNFPERGFAVTVLARPIGGGEENVIQVGYGLFDAADEAGADEMARKEFWTEDLERTHTPIIEVLAFISKQDAAPDVSDRPNEDLAPW